MKCVWVLVIIFVLRSVDAFENEVVNAFRDVRSNERISDQCTDALALYVKNLNSATEDSWALRMLDATSKIPVGLLYSLNYGELGQFDQCLGTESQDGRIKGKYCLGTLSLNLKSNIKETDLALVRQQEQLRSISRQITNIHTRVENDNRKYVPGAGVTWAICLPSNCTDDDVAEILLTLIGSPGAACQTKEDLSPELTNGAIATIVILVLFAILLVESTILDLYYIHNKKEPPHEILVAFSVYKNGRKLFKISQNSTELSCLNGIKFLSMCWVVIGHVFSAQSGTYPLTNYLDLVSWINTVQSMIIISGTLSVDSFFLVGGALVVYGFMKAKHNGVKFNIFYFYVHRYIRLTPALAAAVLVSANLLKYMGSGPRWDSVDSFQNSCQKWWWTTLLYVQNYVNENDLCIAQTWYLSVDMQLYVFSPLILLPLWKYPKFGIALVSSLILAFIVIPFYVAFDLELSGLLTNFHRRVSNDVYMQNYYFKTHTRAAPYLIGTLLGYVIAKIKFSKDQNLRITKMAKPLVLLLWAICIAVTFTCIYAGHSTLRGEEFDRLGNAFYIALVRPVWSVCLAWIILACVMGYGGPINVMLSFPVYQVLNRFTYCIYLLHLTIFYMIGYASRTGTYFSLFNFAYSFWGITMLSFGLSILWVLAFESPMISIEKLIFKGINLIFSKIPICANEQKSQRKKMSA